MTFFEADGKSVELGVGCLITLSKRERGVYFFNKSGRRLYTDRALHTRAAPMPEGWDDDDFQKLAEFIGEMQMLRIKKNKKFGLQGDPAFRFVR